MKTPFVAAMLVGFVGIGVIDIAHGQGRLGVASLLLACVNGVLFV